ncbi:MAG: hypothetical protein KGO81_08350 [Bacteroidota bacterium]|nr:hypothetical protein [Bacteroidota bacterium]
MRTLLACFLFILFSEGLLAQRGRPNMNVELVRTAYGNVFEASRMQYPPIFPMGLDSALRYCFTHFEGMDSVLTYAIQRGDTGKYLRVYFSFIITKEGSIYRPEFLHIGSTKYAKSSGYKIVRYFDEKKNYYQSIIGKMLMDMPFWKPGLVNLVPVDARVVNYIQFWVGINPPPN